MQISRVLGRAFNHKTIFLLKITVGIYHTAKKNQPRFQKKKSNDKDVVFDLEVSELQKHLGDY